MMSYPWLSVVVLRDITLSRQLRFSCVNTKREQRQTKTIKYFTEPSGRRAQASCVRKLRCRQSHSDPAAACGFQRHCCRRIIMHSREALPNWNSFLYETRDPDVQDVLYVLYVLCERILLASHTLGDTVHLCARMLESIFGWPDTILIEFLTKQQANIVVVR